MTSQLLLTKISCEEFLTLRNAISNELENRYLRFTRIQSEANNVNIIRLNIYQHYDKVTNILDQHGYRFGTRCDSRRPNIIKVDCKLRELDGNEDKIIKDIEQLFL